MTVLGISRDSPWSHRAWQEALSIDVPLLSDWNGEAVEAFRNSFEFNGLVDVAARSAFLVDSDGMIRGGWRYEIDEVPDFEELLTAARPVGSS